MTSTNLTPGHVASLCPGCARRTGDASHPSPCDRVRWEGQRHVGPVLNDSWGRIECSDHVAAEASPQPWVPVAPTPTRGIGSS